MKTVFAFSKNKSLKFDLGYTFYGCIQVEAMFFFVVVVCLVTWFLFLYILFLANSHVGAELQN